MFSDLIDNLKSNIFHTPVDVERLELKQVGNKYLIIAHQKGKLPSTIGKYTDHEKAQKAFLELKEIIEN